MKTRGFALILVLWVLVLLSILASSFSSAVRVETRSGIWATDSTTAEAMAIAAINRAVLALSHDDPNQRWRTDGEPQPFTLAGRRTVIRLRNEAGKIDINFVPREILVNFFANQVPAADPNVLADALIDWRDRDSQRSPNGAEAADYLAAGLNYVPSNSPLSSVDELSLVKGFSGSLVEQIRPWITVHARQPRIDISTAPLQVIQALPGITPDLAQSFIEKRGPALQEDQPIDTSDLRPAHRYIVDFPSSSLVNIELEMDIDGYQHREQAVVRLQSADAEFEILARQPMAPRKTES